jgi:mannose-6-phosphate isomerase-like protein (cupin superfamily)
MDAINIAEKFSLFTDYFNPRIIGELNGQQLKAAKIKGEFTWHSHHEEDELFLVIKGLLKIEFRDKTIDIKEGEFIIVPKGVEHKPSAGEEVLVLLFEPATTLNTGNVDNELTKSILQRI